MVIQKVYRFQKEGDFTGRKMPCPSIVFIAFQMKMMLALVVMRTIWMESLFEPKARHMF